MSELIIDDLDKVKKIEEAVFHETVNIFGENQEKFRSLGINMLVSIEGWSFINRKISKVKTGFPENMEQYESIVTIYPVKEGKPLRDKLSGEIPCAAVIFQKWKSQRGDISHTQDRLYQDKLKRQIEEILGELVSNDYVEDENEVYRVFQDARYVCRI